MIIWFYQLIGHLLLPFISIYFAIRIFKDRDYAKGFWQRFGFIKDLPKDSIHFHCASIGEVKTAYPLIIALIEKHPTVPIVVTNITAAGRIETQRLFSSQRHLYQLMTPFDLFWVIRRFYNKVQPQLSIFVEVEIWPQWLLSFKRLQVPLFLVNARVSERSYSRFKSLPSVTQRIFDSYAWIGAQTEADLLRFKQLGVKSVTHTGNLKFSQQLPPELLSNTKQLRTEHELDRPIWIAASVHEGEYQQIIKAHNTLLETYPDTLLIIVPRYPEKFKEVAKHIESCGLSYVSRSSQMQLQQNHRVWLIDSLGELMPFYALANIAFVGGSIVDRGGHNPLEPAALSLPIIMGNYVANCQSTVEMLNDCGALKQCNNETELTEQLLNWFGDEAALIEAGNNAKKLMDQNNSALDITLNTLVTKWVAKSG